jgi:hypothetical protein
VLRRLHHSMVTWLAQHGEIPSATLSVEAGFRLSEAHALSWHGYLRVDALGADDFVARSAEAKRDVVLDVLDLPWPLGATRGREAARDAMLAGLACGVSDGLLHLACHRDIVDEFPSVGDELLVDKLVLLRNGFVKARHVARTNWCEAEGDDLHLLCAMGRLENRRTEDEADELLSRPGVCREDWTEWLLATFKAGYAVGMIDAAVVVVTGEAPGSPKPSLLEAAEGDPPRA